MRRMRRCDVHTRSHTKLGSASASSSLRRNRLHAQEGLAWGEGRRATAAAKQVVSQPHSAVLV